MENKISGKFPCGIMVLSLASFSSATYADKILEEVIITANKRAENKNEVTASIASMNSAYLEAMNVNKLEDISNLTDSVHFTESGLSTQFRIRGIGSGNSQGFEQSVAQYVDGVYYGRAQLFRAPVYDVASIEIMRGSQNSIFGKDSIGGGIAINTAKATSEFSGKIGLGYNPQFDRFEESFYVNGGITETIDGRLSLHGLQDDGYFDNTTKGKSGSSREEQSGRLKLNWRATEDFQLRGKFETGSFNIQGRPYEITQDLVSPLTLDQIARQPGNEALRAIPSTFNNIMTVLVNQPGFETNSDWNRQTNSPEISNNHINNITIDGIYSFDAIEWSTMISHVNYGYNEVCDCDYTPANIFSLKLDEHYYQNSVDSFIKNSRIQETSWLAGIYLQQSELDFHDRFFVPSDSVLAALGSPLQNSGVDRVFYQDGNVFSVYGEYSWQAFEKTELIFSGRFTHDNKKGERALNIIDENAEPIESAALACAYLYGVKADTTQSLGLPYDCGAPTPDLGKGFSPGHDLSAKRKENSFAPAITINQKLSDFTNVFIGFKSGRKSGGYDPRSNSAKSFEFGEESAITGEFGLRSRSRNGNHENSITVFKTSYEDLQVSQYDGALGFNVGNANETKSTGFEFDGRAVLTDSLLLNYSAGYVDIKYIDFKNGNCYQAQVPNGADTNGDGVADLCDYSGKRPGFVPAKTGNIGFQYETELAGGNFGYSLNMQYVGSHNVHENLDPKGIQDAYYMLNSGVSYQIDSLTLRLSANNMTNEYVKTYQANVPLSGSTFGTNTFYAFSKQPRSITTTAEYRF